MTPSVPITEAEIAKAQRLVSEASSLLVLKAPFFAYLVLQRPVQFTERTPTAGADARGRIYVNPRFLLGKHVGTVDKAMFLLAHEAMHIAFLHCLKETTGNRDQKACNIAMDQVINETLIVERVGEFIEGGQRYPNAHTMAWENLYQDPPDGDGGGGGQGSGSGSHQSGDVGGIGEDLMDCPDGEPVGAEAEELAEQMRQEVAAAANAAKTQGKLSANMARLVDELVHVRTPWHEILERFMTAFVQTDYSWKRPNRRFVGHGVYLPSLDKQPRMGRIGIIGDTSGSIGQREVDTFQAHVNRIIETCQPEQVVLLSVDAVVAGVQRFDPDEYPIKWEPKGGGGTDMRTGWDWFNTNEPDVECVICLTDGYTPWPDKVHVPSIVLSTTDQKAPAHVGETVKFDL